MRNRSFKIHQLEESQTLAFTSIARRLREQGEDVISLTAGEPDFPTPAYIKKAAIQAIEDGFTRYTANEGISELRQAIVRKFAEDNQIYFEPSQIVVSSGAKHAVFNALSAICDPGDEVLIPALYYVSYPPMARLVDAVPVIIEATPDTGFKVTAQQLRSAITTKTKALILNTPSNPTGAVYSQKEIEDLASVVAECGIFVIADEIYEKIIYDGVRHFSIGSIPEIKNQVVTVNGLSKAYAMTGWRIGYLGASEEVAQAAAKVQSQVTTNTNSIAQKAAVAALSSPSPDLPGMLEEFKRRRDSVVHALQNIPGVEAGFPQGAFLLFFSVKAYIGTSYKGNVMKSDIDLCNALVSEERLVLVPGTAFGMSGYLRLSYTSPMAQLEEAMTRLKRGLEKLR